MLACAVKLLFPQYAKGIPAIVLAHSIKKRPFAVSVRQASDNAGTSIMQPHSQSQLGITPYILTDF